MNQSTYESEQVRKRFREILKVENSFYKCEQVQDKLRAGAQLVDVRTPEEYSRGALAGAINLPLQYVTLGSNSLSRQKTVLLYCGSGKRSGIAKTVLDSIGFEDVINIGSYAQFKDCA